MCFVMMAKVISLAAYGLGGFYNPRKARADTAARSAAIQAKASNRRREQASAGVG
jgi:hypothetical protein